MKLSILATLVGTVSASLNNLEERNLRHHEHHHRHDFSDREGDVHHYHHEITSDDLRLFDEVIATGREELRARAQNGGGSVERVDLPVCSGFIGMIDYTANAPAQNIPCIPGETDMCCDEFGYFSIVNGDSFTLFLRENPTKQRQSHPECAANVDALALVLCSSKQKQYIKDGALNICKSACDKVFASCSPTGLIPSDITDSTTLCERMWGGVENNSPCEVELLENSFACQEITSINVVSDGSETCFDYTAAMVTPEIIQSYQDSAYAQNQCIDTAGILIGKLAAWTLGLIIFGVVIFICIIGCIIAACCGIINCCR